MTSTETFSFQLGLARKDIAEAAEAVTDWYDANDAAKQSRRDFPATEDLKQKLSALRKAVRAYRKMNGSEVNDGGSSEGID